MAGRWSALRLALASDPRAYNSRCPPHLRIRFLPGGCKSRLPGRSQYHHLRSPGHCRLRSTAVTPHPATCACIATYGYIVRFCFQLLALIRRLWKERANVNELQWRAALADVIPYWFGVNWAIASAAWVGQVLFVKNSASALVLQGAGPSRPDSTMPIGAIQQRDRHTTVRETCKLRCRSAYRLPRGEKRHRKRPISRGPCRPFQPGGSDGSRAASGDARTARARLSARASATCRRIPGRW